MSKKQLVFFFLAECTNDMMELFLRLYSCFLCFYLYLYFYILYCHEEFDRDIKINLNDFFFFSEL